MKPTTCDDLEAYRENGLAPRERRRFQAHLGECPACRGELGKDERMDRLLAMAARRLAAPPPGLVERIVEGLGRSPARPRPAPGPAASRLPALAAALLVLVLGGWLASHLFRGEGPPAPRAASVPRPPIRVRLDPSQDAIALPVKTRDPNVTIIFVYPALGGGRPAAGGGRPAEGSRDAPRGADQPSPTSF